MSDSRSDVKRRPRRRWLVWALEALVVVAIVFAVNLYRTRDAASGPAPPIQAPLLSGYTADLAQLRGQTVLVHFWATWCPICRAEESSIESVAEDWAVLTVAMQSGDASEVAEYLRDRQVSFPVVVDEQGAIAQRYGVTGVPASFVVDPSGRIRFVEVGYTTELGLRARMWLARWLGRE